MSPLAGAVGALRPLEGASDYPAKVQRTSTLVPLMKNIARYRSAPEIC